MDLIPVIVECRSGYKADEYPVRFYWHNTCFEIEQVIDRWHQWNPEDEWPLADYFKISTTDGHEFILKHETGRDEWFLTTYRECISR